MHKLHDISIHEPIIINHPPIVCDYHRWKYFPSLLYCARDKVTTRRWRPEQRNIHIYKQCSNCECVIRPFRINIARKYLTVDINIIFQFMINKIYLWMVNWTEYIETTYSLVHSLPFYCILPFTLFVLRKSIFFYIHCISFIVFFKYIV